MFRFIGTQLKKAWGNLLVRIGVMTLVSFGLYVLLREIQADNIWYSFPIAIFSASLVGFFFEAYEFRKFLQETMMGIIQDKGYLGILRGEKLENMLRNIHRIYYNLPEDFGGQGLYDFVKIHILDYLGRAYEDNVEIEFDFYNRKDYVEIVVVQRFEIMAPSETTQKGDREIVWNLLSIPGKEDFFHYPFERFQLSLKGKEVGFPQESKKVIRDGDILKFSYLLSYEVRRAASMNVEYHLVGYERKEKNMIHQTFKLPTKGFRLRINANDFGDCLFDYHFSGSVPPKPNQVSTENRRFKLDYDGWMIPGNSVTVTFIPKIPCHEAEDSIATI